MKGKFRQTVAAFLALSSMASAPAQTVELNTTATQQEVGKSNKSAVVEERQKKGQGVKVNERTGGLDIDYARMVAHPNPFYIPRVRGWAKQRREANKRRKVNAKKSK